MSLTDERVQAMRARLSDLQRFSRSMTISQAETERDLDDLLAMHGALLREYRAAVADNAALREEISGAMDSLESEVLSERKARWERLQSLGDMIGDEDTVDKFNDMKAQFSAVLERVRELERKRGACEVCWTVSWEPIKKPEDADGVNTIGPDHLARCGYCWHMKQAEAREAAIREALEKYGDHHETCAMTRQPENYPHDCNCGWDKAQTLAGGA